MGFGRGNNQNELSTYFDKRATFCFIMVSSFWAFFDTKLSGPLNLKQFSIISLKSCMNSVRSSYCWLSNFSFTEKTRYNWIWVRSSHNTSLYYYFIRRLVLQPIVFEEKMFIILLNKCCVRNIVIQINLYFTRFIINISDDDHRIEID